MTFSNHSYEFYLYNNLLIFTISTKFVKIQTSNVYKYFFLFMLNFFLISIINSVLNYQSLLSSKDFLLIINK